MRLNAFLILALMLPGLVFSVTHTVKLDGSGDFTAIQAALDASAQGDTVLVYPGRYFENVVIQTNGISLISLEALTNNPAYIDSTIVDGMVLSPCIRVIQSRTEIYIRGFSFTNGLNIGAGGGMLFSSGSVAYVTNCKVHGNTASSGGGINVIGASVSLSGVMIYNNYSVNLGGGLYCTSVTGFAYSIVFNPVNRCSIYNNRSGSGQDIYMQHALSDLNVYLDTFSVAIPTTYHAIYRPEGLADYQMHFDIQNAHHQEIDSDLYVSPDGNDANDGLSPDTAIRSIHEGIYRIAADSLSQNTVRLLPGTYSRTANDQVFPIALKSWVIVQGSGLDTTVVVGEPHPLIPTGYGNVDATFMTYLEPVLWLSDLTITTASTENGSAILSLLKGSINLSNIRIHDVNSNYVASVLLWLDNEHDSVWENVTVENEITSGGGLVDVPGIISGRISNCTFRNATSTFISGSVWAYPLVFFRGDRNLSFENCEFSNLTMLDDNSRAITLGGVQFPQQHNNFSFQNCLFSNNSSQGGVMHVGSSNYPNVSFTNCTFAGNEGDAYTLMANGNVNIINSIFDNDTPYQIKINPMGGNETTTLNLDYSCIKDGISGIQQAPGNTINFLPTSISSDPLFAGSPDIHDPLYYSLSDSSPCVDTGTPDILGLDLLPYDLVGNWRVWNGRIDMGCFEYDSEPWVSNDDPVLPVPNEIMSVYPNPFRHFATIRVDMDSVARGKGALATDARIDVYNLRGQKVKSIALDLASKGFFSWDGTNEMGNVCANGIYVLGLSLENKLIQSKRVTLLK
ncbi:MAG TPA: hypothetical protein PLQ80_09815 [Candidatus Syntrophosphaera sp.]|nr:hypothetical protein [Candidatus Syntrophosphaera sp.]